MKNFASSLTVWGLALIAGIQAAEGVGALPFGSSEALKGFGTSVGVLLALVGRWRADKPLTLGATK